MARDRRDKPDKGKATMSHKNIITMKTYQNKIVKCEGIKIVKHDGSKAYAEKKSVLINGTRLDRAKLKSAQPARSNVRCLMSLETGRTISIALSRVATGKPGSMQRDNQARVDVLLQPQLKVLSANTYRKAIAIQA